MAITIYGRRFTRAVFEIALEKNELDMWQSYLRKIAGISDDSNIMALLHNPKLDFGIKAKLLTERLGDIDPLASNLANMLVARGRLSMAGDIADEYQRLLDKHRGIEHAEVTAAIPIGDEDRQTLAERLSAMVGKKVMVESEVDASLVGGIVVRVGGKLLDGSTRSTLLALKKELGGAAR